MSLAAALDYHPPQGPLSVLYQDDDLLVLSKPAGLLSVPGKDPKHADCLESRAKAQFPNALLIHRLDMATSGVFVMAMNKAAQAHIGKQFEKRCVRKTYIAKVWGVVEGESGRIDLPLRCDWPNRPLQMVCHKEGRAAQTDWRVIERSADWTRVELSPLTGRSHQLRVHMKELGHPILGDVFYADGPALAASDRLCLHAARLVLTHPAGGQEMVFEDGDGDGL